jgi:hypothetical protein
VNQLAGTPGCLTGVLPRCTEGHDPFAVSLEDERADGLNRLQPFMLSKLALQDRLDVGRKGKRPSLTVLRRVRV